MMVRSKQGTKRQSRNTSFVFDNKPAIGAIKIAIGKFGITDPEQQRRLVARRSTEVVSLVGGPAEADGEEGTGMNRGPRGAAVFA